MLGVGRVSINILLGVGRLNLKVEIGSIGRYRRIGRRGTKLSRDSRSSAVSTDDSSANGVALVLSPT